MKIVRKLKAVLAVLSIPGGLSKLLKAKPRSLVSLKIAECLHREGVAYKTIIDGGANIGQFARAVSMRFPHAKIISFEPLPDVADQLKANLTDLGGRVVLHNFALGQTDGEAILHRCSSSQSSSILSLDTQSKDSLESGVREIAEIKVQVRCLDSVFRGAMPEQPFLLKLDLQGYELEALKGATELLKHCQHVLLEAVFKPSYAGEPLFDEIADFLRSCGFRFQRPMSFAEGNSGEIVQIDALFSSLPFDR